MVQDTFMMKSLFNGCYSGKTVLVTGHTGFKGAWLSLWLAELGARVAGYALEPPTDPSLFAATGLESLLEHRIGDVRDSRLLAETVAAIRPDMVFHLAAQPLVRLSYREPRETYETNIMGTVNLFEAIRAAGSVRAAVIITSDKCYENREWVYGYRENDAMGGFDPYSSSKGCAELVTAAYRNSYFNAADIGSAHNTAVASVRAGNVIGGGDWAEDRLIPDCVRSLAKGETIVIRNPHATRPWQHVLEPLSGYLWLGARLMESPAAHASGWNFGPENDDIVTVEAIVKETIRIWGSGAYSVPGNSGPHEAKLLKLDISKARSHLLWRPVYDASTALEKTVSWYREFYRGNGRMLDTSRRQIREYADAARARNIPWSAA
jgi:CDP-glucose 4,6-dehydratase